MRKDVEAALRKFENKLRAAVEADTELGHTDSSRLEKKAKLFWEQFYEAKHELRRLLDHE